MAADEISPEGATSGARAPPEAGTEGPKFIYNPEELPDDEWIEFYAEANGQRIKIIITDSEGLELNYTGIYELISIPDILKQIYTVWKPEDEGMLKAEIIFPWGYPYTDAKEYVEWHVRNKIFLKVLEWLKQFWVSPY